MQGMSLATRQILEGKGFTVYEKYDETKGMTFTYVHHPENNLSDPSRGLDNKYFASLMDITRWTVDDGEYIDLDAYAWPVIDCPPDMGYYDENEAWPNELTWKEPTYNEKGELITDPLSWALLFLAITLLVGVIVLGIIRIMQTLAAPCGETQITDIPGNECWKIIRSPDCKHAEFNACGGPDNNQDGKPDGQWAGAAEGESGTPNWKGGWDISGIIMWIVIGAIAIGGTYVAIKLLAKPKKQYYPSQPSQQYYYPQPQAQQYM